MLFTRNAHYFRKYFKEEVAREKNWLDLNFVGSLHPDKTKSETGFAKLIYGNRDDLGKLLGTIALNVAADDQAIYELIQNADDSKSSFFSVSYNEKYLLCINNGNYFSDNDMSAIINVAGNFKEGEDIGTFGIGFKILHRLVGTDDGRDAIINNYAGPIIFSWNKYFQLEKFLNGEEIKIGGYDIDKKQYSYEKDQENAWLIKILYTCFPTHFEEKVRLKDYKTQESKFEESELNEMREFLKNSLQNVNLTETNYLKKGSIFFLKLGEGKSKFLDDGIDKIKNGLSYSFKFLNSLQKIYINGEEIKAQPVTDYSYSFPINSIEFNEINPKNKNREIKFTFAYYRDYKKAENLRNELAPNLYTFFSMDEEKNGFSFLLHCNAFDMNNDRRKLQANSQINERLLPIIAESITQYIESQKNQDRHLFLALYANLLLSKEPKSKPHINNSFFKYFQKYILENIPTFKSYSNNTENVKIKNTFLEISPSDFGCPEIEWFFWNNEKNDSVLISEARNSDKLNLEKWDIIDLIKYAVNQNKLDNINDWIKKIEIETLQIFAEERKLKEVNNLQDFKKKAKPYYTLLSEINKNILKSNIDFINQIKLFKFSDGNFYSLNEIFKSEDLVLNYEKTFDVRYELQNFGFLTSVINIDSINSKGNANYSNIKDLIQTKLSDLHLFQKIASRAKINTLKKDQKHKLFFALKNFDGVDVENLRDLELFKDSFGNIRPLRTLLKEGDTRLPNWLDNFKISPNEYLNKLDEYLVKDKDIYQSIIYKNWDLLIALKLNIKDFYKEVTGYYKQNHENQKLDKLASIFTNDGFKSVDQVFFNANLNCQHYYELQNTILKISDKAYPSKIIFDFLIDEQSPFKVNRNDTIGSLVNSDCTLSYRETFAVLEFAKINNEKLFSFAYIEKQADEFLLAKHSQGVFQYYSSQQEINQLLSIQPDFKLLPQVFNANEYRELGILQDKSLYLKIIQTLSFSENLLPVVRECDKEVQLAYLDKLETFSLHEEKIYDGNSFEHRCLKLAVDCYNINFQIKFAPKILLNNSIRIKDIAVKDDINFESVTLSLSNVLPEYKGVSDIITKIINQFTDITKSELSEKVFPISNKKKDEIYSELIAKFPALQTIEQFAFLLYYSKQIGKKLFTDQSLTALSKIDILQFAYKQKFTELNDFVDLSFQNKIYPSELGLEIEKLPSWVLSWTEGEDNLKKLDFISQLGVHTFQSTIVMLRNYFINKTMFDLNDIAKDASLSDGKLLINTLLFIKEKGIELSSDKQYLVLKEIERVVNSNSVNENKITINDNYSVEEIINNSKASDKKTKEYKIFLYQGKLPKIVSISEIVDYVYYRYNDGDYFVNHFDIYINEECDHKTTLEKVVSDDTNGFTFEDLWNIYNENEPKVDNPFKDISPEDERFIRGIIGGEYELNEKLDANTTAKIKTLIKIRDNYPGLRISNQEYFLQVGEIKILVRSAQNGLLFLDVNHWARLGEPNVHLSIYTKNDIHIFENQEALIEFTKPQNKYGILKMPDNYDLDDLNSINNGDKKGVWRFVFIVNEDAKAAKKYKEIMDLDEYNNYGQ
jgi:hypothetical protein